MGDEQQEVVAFLRDPASYPPGAAPVEIVETHGSLVFLAGGYAYKLKRAVKYAYLDFSTLALRLAACSAELRLNRRTAPLSTSKCGRSAAAKTGVCGGGGPGGRMTRSPITSS